jgi:hypothetical protein
MTNRNLGHTKDGSDAYDEAISNGHLTAEEKRNLERTKAWSDAYGDLDNIERFCDMYADSTEIYTPLQDWYWAKQGHSNEAWRNGEIEVAKLTGSRKEKIVSILARGNTVAVQVAIDMSSKDGKHSRQGCFAAFLKFDEDGKIVSDHSFLGRQPPPSPDQAPTPELKASIEKLLEINT